jgi:hypothetical protein
MSNPEYKRVIPGFITIHRIDYLWVLTPGITNKSSVFLRAQFTASWIPHLYKLINLVFKYVGRNTNLLFKFYDFI